MQTFKTDQVTTFLGGTNNAKSESFDETSYLQTLNKKVPNIAQIFVNENPKLINEPSIQRLHNIGEHLDGGHQIMVGDNRTLKHVPSNVTDGGTIELPHAMQRNYSKSAEKSAEKANNMNVT